VDGCSATVELNSTRGAAYTVAFLAAAVVMVCTEESVVLSLRCLEMLIMLGNTIPSKMILRPPTCYQLVACKF